MGNLVEWMSIDCTNKNENENNDNDNDNDLNIFNSQVDEKSNKIINQIELYPDEDDNESKIYKKHYEENSIIYENSEKIENK
jgi:hypothetical protein